MKKIAVALTLLMLVGLLIGCGGIPQDVQNELNQLRAENQGLKAELAKVPKSPTYDGLVKFLKEDPTEKLWPPPAGEHLEMANKLLKAAGKSGIEGSLAIATIKNQYWFFAAFKTTDRGTVYVLAALDGMVKLEEGKDYYKINNFPPQGDAIISKIWLFD